MPNKAYDVTIRRLATGADYSLRLFAVDADTACQRATERARFACGISPAKYRELNAQGIAVFRVVSCAVSADQSRPSNSAELPSYEDALKDPIKARVLFDESKGGNVRGITENHRAALLDVFRQPAPRATLYYLETKEGARAKWRALRFARPYADLDSAIAGARALDEDGLFRSDVRVVSEGVVVATHKTVSKG